ncbi:hypothetical protein [Paramicrobacterium agarici]|uniref:Uncharacterized protein n=1 Tax=Paramicrobacterium agarici TaxID=630514 RepID=A0A2A9DSD3_9MICO|nr:hypothetical protein [Microbacterium agarici]PFG29588.1 hypothetical protein ATJ78_0496 [Microbacterium agarici]TQO22593.1 hypothetical protein FB385_1425 [Microbacterium agarici]
MASVLERDPWVRTGVSIGTVPLYLLVTHVLAGIVYRALSTELALGERIAAAVTWAVLGALVVGAFSWLVTWRTAEGRPMLHWWIAPVVGIVTIVEFVIVVVAIVIPHGDADAAWGAAIVEQIASPRFWAGALWMPLTAWICVVATVRVRWFRPPRMVMLGVVPYVLAGVVFVGLLNGGVYENP